jgi:hypothetical protein
MLSGNVIGFICVIALLLASILMAALDRREKGRGNAAKSRFLSRMALGLFLAAFVGGVVVTLIAGVRPREEGQVMTGRPMGGSPMGGPGAAIGKVDEAEFQRLIEKVNADPKDVASRERLGHLYLQQQDFENVFRMAHEALQINPKSAESRAHMGMVLFAMQEFDQAIAQFDQALQSDPKNLEALLFKGIVQFQGKDDLKGAKETWDRYMKHAKPTDAGYDRVQMFLKTINEQLRPAR